MQKSLQLSVITINIRINIYYQIKINFENLYLLANKKIGIKQINLGTGIIDVVKEAEKLITNTIEKTEDSDLSNLCISKANKVEKVKQQQ